MNENANKKIETDSNISAESQRRHPYTMSNTPEETMRRMRAFPERFNEFVKTLEKVDADREANQS